MSDIVVVGGGIVGASVAYHAARAGMSVTVFDRGDEGYATAAGAGIITAGIGGRQADAYDGLVTGSVAYYPRLVANLASDGAEETGYDRVGGLIIAANAAEAEALRAAREGALTGAANGGPEGSEISLIDGKQARALFPALGAVPAALHLANAARVDGRLMRAALRSAAERHGSTFRRDNAAVARVGRRIAVTSEGRKVAAGAVVLAAGAWSAPLGAALGVALPIFPQRGQIVHLELPETDTSRWPVVLTMQDHYLLTFPRNRVVVGATRENDAGFDYRLTAGGVYQVLGQALQVAPGLQGATLREMRIGFRPVAPDGLPVLGRLSGLENGFIATGHGPNGLTLGPYSGALLVDLIRGEAGDIALAPFGAERFMGMPNQ